MKTPEYIGFGAAATVGNPMSIVSGPAAVSPGQFAAGASPVTMRVAGPQIQFGFNWRLDDGTTTIAAVPAIVATDYVDLTFTPATAGVYDLLADISGVTYTLPDAVEIT